MGTRRATTAFGLILIAISASSAGEGATVTSEATHATVLVEAEGFDEHGGWVVDQQAIDQMGSAYLLAHGLGVPVDDAATTVRFPAEGTYRVMVRTRDWVA